jgi:hypothetical protein
LSSIYLQAHPPYLYLLTIKNPSIPFDTPLPTIPIYFLTNLFKQLNSLKKKATTTKKKTGKLIPMIVNINKIGEVNSEIVTKFRINVSMFILKI